MLFNLTGYQQGTYYEEIKIFNTLPFNIKSLHNDTEVRKQALKDYLLPHPFCSMEEFT
jgi:hypothetical protein